MKAELIFHNKIYDVSGNIVEIKLWKVKPASDKPHGYKYSLAYIAGGKRIIGYDNSEGKGDHKHYKGKTKSYDFKGLEKLVSDFYKDIINLKEKE